MRDAREELGSSAIAYRLFVGHGFIAASGEEGQEFVAKKKEQTEARLSAARAELAAIRDRKAVLRDALTSRLGTSIGLDTAEDDKEDDDA